MIAERLAGTYAGGLLLLSVVHAVAPQRTGWIALSQVFAPHLFLPLMLLLPLAALRGSLTVRGLVLVAAGVGLVRFWPGIVSPPQAPLPGAQQLNVLSWNLAADLVTAELLVDRLLSADAHLVALQELKAEHVAAIEAEPLLAERYPHRLLVPHATVFGMGVLSRHPITDGRVGVRAPFIAAELELGDDRRLLVINAHALPPRMNLIAGLIPLRYDSGERDRSLAVIRELVRPALANERPVLLVGDLNLTDREPAYAELSSGLIDAHRSVGLGPGSTWRPLAFASFLPFGLLRIDYIFVGGGAQPRSCAVDCVPVAGDHCLVSGTIEIP